MPVKKKKVESPLTLSQLIKFYNELIEPRFQKLERKIDTVESNLVEAFEKRLRA